MTDPSTFLGDISGGRVLDVATGSGGFVRFLLDGLKDYDEIIGIDVDRSGERSFADAFTDDPRIRFEQMDALAPAFPPASFDTVAVSDSLHHFEDPMRVLEQMKRLARPGGRLIVSEMYRDNQSETQRTHVLLHHWCGAVDRLAGTVHRPTYRRSELVRLVQRVARQDASLSDLSDTDTDAKDPDMIAHLDGVIDRYLIRAAGHRELCRRGEMLRRRLRVVGIHAASTLLAIART